jgi:hypothetical protein
VNAACPYCRGEFESDDGMTLCQACATPHHQDCYAENGGCTVFGCRNAPGDEPKIRVLIEDLGDPLPSLGSSSMVVTGITAPAPRWASTALTGEEQRDRPLPVVPRFGVLLERSRPAPPSLPWGVLLLLSMLSVGLFQLIWDLALARWMRELQPQSRAIYYYGAVVVLLLVVFAGVAGGRINATDATAMRWFAVAMMVLWLTGRFSMMRSLEDYFDQTRAMGLSLSEGMTLVFGSLYFQYHLNHVTKAKAEHKQAIA